jgi:uncharacterized protein YdbL (DUF1318 family)
MKYGFRRLLSLFIFLSSGGCSLPPVALTTPKPVQVDINMRVDVYQYAGSHALREKKVSKEEADILRSNRQADLQSFKSAQYIGEGHEGLLTILKEPPDELKDRIRRAVEAENAARSIEMQKIAKKEKTSLSEVQNRQGEANRMGAFKGEWIEQPQLNGTFKWIQKGQ